MRRATICAHIYILTKFRSRTKHKKREEREKEAFRRSVFFYLRQDKNWGVTHQKKVKKKKREKKTLSFFTKIIKAHSSFVRAITNQNQ